MLKNLFSLITLFLIAILPIHGSSEAPLKHIRYAFSLKEISQNKLLVKCEFQGSATGVTELRLPYQWANQLELYKNISTLTCSEHTIEDTDQPYIKNIHHKPNAVINIGYSVQLLSENIDHKNYFRPIGNCSYFYGIGHGMFIIPNEQDSQMIMTLDWKDIPQNWKIANSFGKEQTTQEIIGSPYDLQPAAFLAGDFQTIECNHGTNPVYIAIKGTWPFSIEEFSSLIEQIFSSQRDFWHDHAFPYYLVSAIPIDAKNSTGGTALTNTFSLFLGENRFSKDEFLKHLAWLISHEHFHTWNGHKIRSSEPEGSMYWFSEGFTEYYSVKLNHKNGIMSQDDYVDHINEILINYFLSPVHNASNETITKNFWTDSDVEQLPYVRGFTLAFYLDTKIKSESQGASLDNLMHDLLELTNRTGKPFSFDDFSNLMANYLKQEDLNAVKQYVNDGKTISISQDALGPNYSLEWEDYLGFNLRKSLAKGTVEGVKRESIPAKTGLSNGSKILAFNRNGTTVTLSIIDTKDAVEKSISYDIGAIKQVPQYVLTQEK